MSATNLIISWIVQIYPFFRFGLYELSINVEFSVGYGSWRRICTLQKPTSSRVRRHFKNNNNNTQMKKG